MELTLVQTNLLLSFVNQLVCSFKVIIETMTSLILTDITGKFNIYHHYSADFFKKSSFK